MSSPAPTVWFVMRSMRMKPPVSRLSTYGSNATGFPQLDVDDADLVQVELRRRDLLERVDLELVLDRRHGRRHLARADTHQVRAAAQQRFLGHPDDGRLELLG